MKTNETVPRDADREQVRPTQPQAAASTGERRLRPHGWLRHYGGLVAPSQASALRIMNERNGRQRVERLRAATIERTRERRQPSGPRMRALQALPSARLSWTGTRAPREPGPLEAVVHPIAVATCDLDCSLALGHGPFPLPLHLGHECVAEVLTVGEQVSGFSPGELVVVPFQINCGECRACMAGCTANCLAVPPVSAYGMGLATGHWGGAFSDELAVPFADAMLVALPAGVDPAAAAGLADNVCDAYRHFAQHLPPLLEDDPEAQVLILSSMHGRAPYGASSPVYAALIARALGARNVLVVEARAHVRDHLHSLGVEAIPPKAMRGLAPAPLVVDVTFDSLGLALSHTAENGVCSSAGALHGKTRVPVLQMYVRGATLHVGLTHARALIPQVLELMASSDFDPTLAITTRAPLDDAPSVLVEHFLSGGVKAVFTA